MPLEGGRSASPPCFRLRPDFIAYSILLTLRKYELLYLDVRSISLAHAVVSLFYLRIKKQSPARGGTGAEYGFSSLLLPAHDIRRVYRVYIKSSSVARTSAILLLRANNERFENNLIDRRLPVRPPCHLRPFLKDARGDNPPSRRRARFYPSGCFSRHLYVFPRLLIPWMFRPFPFRSRIDAKPENTRYLFFLLSTLPRCPLWSASREVMKQGAEKLSPRFHPNVTDLTSRGDAARFPQIIILLSYNSFNSRESKTRRRRRRRV